MPEQGHLFLQRRLRREHAVGPPIGQAVGLQAAGAKPVKKLVHHRLQAPVAGWLDLDAQGLTGLFGLRGHGRAAGGERLETRVMDGGFIEGCQRFASCAWAQGRALHQRFHGRLRRHRRQTGDLFRCAAKTGPLKQMRGPRRAPLLRREGREVVGPTRRIGLSKRRRGQWPGHHHPHHRKPESVHV